MKIPLCWLALAAIFQASLATASTATATLQLVWPGETLGLSESEVFAKAEGYLKSEAFWQGVASLPKADREQLAPIVGINDPQNIAGIAQGLDGIISVDSDPAHGVFTIFVDTPNPDLSLKLARRCLQVATHESRYRIAAQTDPKVGEIKQQMESVEDEIQQYTQQIRLSRQEGRARARTDTRGASIGLPTDMGGRQVANVEGQMAKAQNTNIQNQIAQLRHQYNELRQQLNKEIHRASQDQPQIGLMVIDEPDLEASGSQPKSGPTRRD